MSDSRPRVRAYMTKHVDVVAADETVGKVAAKLETLGDHDGFPVCRDGQLVGLVTARHLLLNDNEAAISDVMETAPPVAAPSMKTKNAARVMLREGTSDLPVVEDEDLVGIITHADVLRSQIERTTPSKVNKLVSMFGDVHDVSPTVERKQVPIAALIPTQTHVYADELKGRRYELENDLAEPLVVVQSCGELLLVDGHHRAVAASEADIGGLDAYIIDVGDVSIGMRETAREQRLTAINDVQVDENEEHPLVETISRLRKD